tara:strand:- start:519 stop:677 length:159 start_codon:yes stop_codon:yes gene_type:complete
MAKKYNELLVSELQAKYNVLAEIDMKRHKNIVIHISVFDEREMLDDIEEGKK